MEYKKETENIFCNYAFKKIFVFVLFAALWLTSGCTSIAYNDVLEIGVPKGYVEFYHICDNMTDWFPTAVKTNYNGKIIFEDKYNYWGYRGARVGIRVAMPPGNHMFEVIVGLNGHQSINVMVRENMVTPVRITYSNIVTIGTKIWGNIYLNAEEPVAAEPGKSGRAQRNPT